MEPFPSALFPNPWTEINDSPSSRTVYLQNWWLIKADKDFNGKTLAVQGTSSTGGQRRQVVRVFSSAPIVKRYDVFTIETADGISIILNGFLNKVRTCENGFSTEVFNHFLFGFPLNWEECAERCFVADVIKKEGLGGKTCPSRIPTRFPLKKEGSHTCGGEGSHEHSASMLDKKKSGHVHLASPSGALSMLKYFRTRTRSGGLNNKFSAVRLSEYATDNTVDATPTKLEITRENQKNNENEDLLPKQDMETRTSIDSIRMYISIKKEKKLGRYASVAPSKSESGRQNQEDNQKEDIVSKPHKKKAGSSVRPGLEVFDFVETDEKIRYASVAPSKSESGRQNQEDNQKEDIVSKQHKKKAGSSVRPGLEVFDFVETDEKNLDLNASDDLNAAATDSDSRQNREGNQEEGPVSSRRVILRCDIDSVSEIINNRNEDDLKHNVSDAVTATPANSEGRRQKWKGVQKERAVSRYQLRTKTSVPPASRDAIGSVSEIYGNTDEMNLDQKASDLNAIPTNLESKRQKRTDTRKERVVSGYQMRIRSDVPPDYQGAVSSGLEVRANADETNLDQNASSALKANLESKGQKQKHNQKEGLVSSHQVRTKSATSVSEIFDSADKNLDQNVSDALNATPTTSPSKRKNEKDVGKESSVSRYRMRTKSTVPPANGNECNTTKIFGHADGKKLDHNVPDALHVTPTNGGTGRQNQKDQRDSHIKGRSMPCRPPSQRTDAKPATNSKGRRRQRSAVKKKECSVALKVSDCKRSRSGRILLPSLEFWRNQIAIYDADGQVTAIKEG